MKDIIIKFLEGCRNGVLCTVLLVPVYVAIFLWTVFVADPIYEKVIDKLDW